MALQWTVAQIGAREHYAIAAALARHGSLRALYTDVWVRTPAVIRDWYPTSVKAILARRNPDIPNEQVRSFTASTLWRELARRVRGSSTGLYEDFIEAGRSFATAVRDDLDERPLNADTEGFFGYNTGCLEVFEMLRERGVLCVVDQIDPARVEDAIVREERERWPGWEPSAPAIPESYWQRLQDEWTLADRVVVNSAWSRSALEQQGVPRDKIAIVPLAYEPPHHAAASQRSHVTGAPLVVLWLGAVNLRKGIPYLLEAARRLEGEPVRFVVAGPVFISARIVASAPRNVQFIGRVARPALRQIYADADVFVLPTISDGFAITQLEAMAHGLPVVTTPNCGEVVTDGVDGFIVPARDSEQLGSAIGRLSSDRSLAAAMSARAVRRSEDFSLARVASLIGALGAREAPRVANHEERPAGAGC